MKPIYSMLLSPMARSVSAFLVGVFFVGHFFWNFKSRAYLSGAHNWNGNNPAEFYLGAFLICVGLVSGVIVYWMRLRRSRRTVDSQPS